MEYIRLLICLVIYVWIIARVYVFRCSEEISEKYLVNKYILPYGHYCKKKEGRCGRRTSDVFTQQRVMQIPLRREYKTMITKKPKLKIRKDFSIKKPTIWLGKNGITEEFIGQLLKQFEKNEVVKIKILKSFLKIHNTFEISKKLIKQTNSNLI